jgi:hypothetical protein
MILQILKDQFILHIFKTLIALLGEIATIDQKKGLICNLHATHTNSIFTLQFLHTIQRGKLKCKLKFKKTKNRSQHSKTIIRSKSESRNKKIQ